MARTLRCQRNYAGSNPVIRSKLRFSMDVPDAVADSVVSFLRHSLPKDDHWISSRELYRWYWSWYLRCYLTQDEADSILGRMNGLGPKPINRTYGGLERSDTSFWTNRKGLT